MKIVLDLHTHSIASGHAYSTIQEMATFAAEKGLLFLGITEHGPLVPGAPDPIYFRNLYCIPKVISGVRILHGAELNICDLQGNLDLGEDYYGRFDHVVAGVHKFCFPKASKEQNTDAVLAAMHNPRVNIISHPADGAAEVCLEALVRASKETRTLLEVNNSSLNPYRKNPVAGALNTELLRLCRKYNTPVILGSDAHIAFSIADYANVYELLRPTDFPEELIVNTDMRRFNDFTGLELG